MRHLVQWANRRLYMFELYAYQHPKSTQTLDSFLGRIHLLSCRHGHYAWSELTQISSWTAGRTSGGIVQRSGGAAFGNAGVVWRRFHPAGPYKKTIGNGESLQHTWRARCVHNKTNQPKQQRSFWYCACSGILRIKIVHLDFQSRVVPAVLMNAVKIKLDKAKLQCEGQMLRVTIPSKWKSSGTEWRLKLYIYRH